MTRSNHDEPFQGKQIDNYVFRAIADCTYDWESWHQPEGRLLWVNAAVERITGYTPEECLQMADYPLPLVAVEDRDKLNEILQDAIGGGSGNDVDFRVTHKDGSTRWAAISWQPMHDQHQTHRGFRASVRDVTERYQLREQLRLHNQQLEQLVQERSAKIAMLEEQRLRMEKLAALGQMAAGVAHEVNNPLAGIRNAFALFKSNLAHDDENYELLELIDREIERISSITHQMYQLYRPSQQAPRRFDLRRTASDIVVLAQPLAAKNEVRVLVETGEINSSNELGSSEVVLHEGELKQVLLNVVRNAIQATPSGRTVCIRIETNANDAILAVVDQGSGIANDVVDRVFDPFFTTKAETREGMGLGLSVSRSLVEAMGGTIVIFNQPQNGACVKITLPRRVAGHE